ncbi:C-reactive protein-like [Pristis pectinata]|uniref:C-reactive protein-like n=1 Tax=Pristis pectinata TaxID=685728 RepID=UPI00223E1F62|nr:C-reactive protein-like [Pristis pectinata]
MYILITTFALLVGFHPTSAVSGGLRGKCLIFSQPSSTSYVKLLPRRFPELDGRRRLVKKARQGHDMTGGGVVILGQEQDQVGGGFDAEQSFVGELSQVNLLDRVLGQREIGEINRGCGCLGGNVIDWSTVAFESRGTVGISDSPEYEL